ncbi:DNA/RNA non-specific endonuclease [Nocardiopsis sp. FIRDI 009]|uniref:DNA/RNA non-specific endonuclease n=1 Tax=Nocardiopsis sp. FIRDI 009 TaxID=714197 RepID=UPI0013001FD1|nr:DNA/RNA non-specific endonuclease [Nocardiopsis sp. FIRDI 009]
MSLDLALEHQAEQARVAANAARSVVDSWRDTIDPDNIRESLRTFVDEAIDVVTAAQFATAGRTESYLDRVLPSEPSARVNPRALVGVASDGRDLSTLLARPAITALGLIANGASAERAMAAAAVSLERIVHTQVADAGRAADLVGITAHPGVVGYTRVVKLPACADCIALAGQVLSWAEGFARHPQCDCAVMPLTADDPPPQSPRELFERMSPDEQARRFGAARAEAIRQGADIGQVISTRRRMSVAGRRPDAAETTTNGENSEPRTEDIVDGDRVRSSRSGRAMPEQIIAESNGDREAVIQSLTDSEYLTLAESQETPTLESGSSNPTSSASGQSVTGVKPDLVEVNIRRDSENPKDRALLPEEGKRFGNDVTLEPNTRYRLTETDGRWTDYITGGDGKIIEVRAESKGWNSRHPEFLNPRREMTYVVDHYTYRTDGQGRTISAEGRITHKTNERNDSRQREVGARGKRYFQLLNKKIRDDFIKTEHRKPEPGEVPQYQDIQYDGGHLIGSQYYGIGDPLNMVPMRYDVNQNRTATALLDKDPRTLGGIEGAFYNVERAWRGILKHGAKWHLFNNSKFNDGSWNRALARNPKNPQIDIEIKNIYDPNLPELRDPNTGEMIPSPPVAVKVKWYLNGKRIKKVLHYNNLPPFE